MAKSFITCSAVVLTLVALLPPLLSAQEKPPGSDQRNQTGTLPTPRDNQSQNGPSRSLDGFGEDATLGDLIGHALAQNPKLAELQADAEARWAKVPQVTALPDPVFSANVFALPVETAAGSQRTSLSFSQRIPSLRRLDAQGRQAAAEASAAQQTVAAESLKVIAAVKTGYYRLFFIDEQMRINKANQTLLESLGKVANASVQAGASGAGDVLRANLELSTLKKDLLELERQLASTRAEINRILNRPAAAPLPTPIRETLGLLEPAWRLEPLVELAGLHQPELQAARLRYEATAVGVEVARLLDVPDVTLGASYVFVDNNRHPSSVVEVGRDSLFFGVSVTLPVNRSKYTAARLEASARSRAAAAQVTDVSRRYESTLADLIAQAQTARKTMELYDKTVLPLARQTYRNDLEAYSQPNPRVDFDRLVTNYRNLLGAEVDFSRAITDLAVAEVRIEQLVAVPLQSLPVPPEMTTPKKEDTENDNQSDKND